MRQSKVRVLLGCAGALLALWSQLSSARAESELRLALAGDVMFGRWHGTQWRAHQNPLADPFVQRLRSAHLAIANLETGVCSESVARAHAAQARAQTHRLTAPPARLGELSRAGIDVAVVANNHALDCGRSGLSRTLRALAARRILALGAHVRGGSEAPRLILRRGKFEIVMMAASQHPGPIPGALLAPFLVRTDDLTLGEQVASVRARHPRAVLLVSLHWGEEFAVHPAAHQQRFARRLITLGADLVYGHGPHVLQDIERFESGAIVYSTGNLHFDMQVESALVEVSFAATRGRPRLVGEPVAHTLTGPARPL